MSENTSGPQASDLPATHTVSTNDLADYPVGTLILLDDQVVELLRREQVADGVRVVVWPIEDGKPDQGLEVARADCGEPLWEVFTQQPTNEPSPWAQAILDSGWPQGRKG